MRRFNYYLPDDLFNRIKLLANKYNIPISKMMIKLLEIGYLRFLDIGGKISETNNK